MATDRSSGSTVVGVFEDRRHAEAAVNDLEKAGFREDQIGLARRDGGGAGGSGDGGGGEVTTDTGHGSGAATGAVTGTVLGGLLGAAAALLIPGIGPVVAAGILGPIIGSAAAGAGIGALGGALTGGLVTTGVREEDAQYYGGEFEAGRTLVTVKAGDRANEAREILRRHGAYGVEGRGDTQAPQARTTQTTTTTHAAASTGAMNRQANDSGAIRVPEVEERLEVEKRERQMGEVRIEKHVETRQETVPVELEREEVHVERRQVAERPVGQGENVEAFKEGTIRVPVRGEEAVVSKEAVVTGEVVIDKERTTEREQISDTVRRTTVEVDENTRDSNRDARR